MSILDFILAPRRKTAAIAKERLQIIVSHERARRDGSPDSIDYLPLLQKELLQVISKYVQIDENQVRVEVGHSGDRSVLELNITLPD